ncbi:hypothetical protein [Nakamurella endophytica]|uniref:Uncharacterized protein n=1 Tax=Nakamurella endophytica TaxID=1748367 RepID=A0A917T063_9ACTN|nr:hypothetical protein [Nakamurella endophytica]GGM05696.1 hypothetical protein GCM10011594_27390 [Nakamurella endophytica]
MGTVERGRAGRRVVRGPGVPGVGVPRVGGSAVRILEPGVGRPDEPHRAVDPGPRPPSAPSARTSTPPTPGSGTASRGATAGTTAAGTLPETRATAGTALGTGSPGRFGTPAAPIEVAVTGMVLIDRAGAAVLCRPYVDGGGAIVGGPPNPTPRCDRPIPLTGLHADHLAGASHNADHRWARTHLVGRWDGRGLAVEQQGPPTADDVPERDVDTEVPCRPPAGGWTRGATQELPGIDRIAAAVGPAFGALALGYPEGHSTGSDGDLSDAVQVVVVGTTGDVAPARAAARSVFAGNLCVVRAAHTDREIQRQHAALRSALEDRWQALGVWAFGSRQVPLGTPSSSIEVDVDTPQLEAVLSRIPGPPVTVHAWLAPVG